MEPWPHHQLFSVLFGKREELVVRWLLRSPVGLPPRPYFNSSFPDLGWSISSLPKQQEHSLAGFRIKGGCDHEPDELCTRHQMS